MNKKIIKYVVASITACVVIASACVNKKGKTSNWAYNNTGEPVCGIQGIAGADIDIGESVLDWAGKPMIIAVVDSEIPVTCKDLKGIITNPSETDCDEENNHAVSVAGIISTNSESNYESVLKNASIYSIVIDPAEIDILRLINDLENAEECGIRVINMSFTMERFSQDLYDYMRNSKMLFICSAGNGGRNHISFPAAFDLDNVISVIGINNRGICSDISNYSSEADIAAPGENVLCITESGRTTYLSGTSFAAPFVSACCAYLISETDCDATTAKRVVCTCANHYSSLEGFVKEGRILSVKNVIEYIAKEQTFVDVEITENA